MNNEDVRKLVALKQIKEIRPIENADAIEVASIDGWDIVVKKDEFKVGQEVVYFEIDSFLPDTADVFKFLMSRGKKKAFNDKGEQVEGHRLKTIKLRGQISQGLILSIEDFDGLNSKLENTNEDTRQKVLEDYIYNDLGVFKYEVPLPMEPFINGTYPSFTQKTDSVRVQNLSDDYLLKLAEESEWFASEKIDGTSSTWWKDEDGILNVASRNYTLDINESPLHLAIAEKYKLNDILKPGDVIKGEIYGEGIQGNPLQVKGQHLALFDYENQNGSEISKELESLRAPLYNLEFPKTVREAVNQVDKLKSNINKNRYAEGIVWWSKDHKEFNKLGNRPNFKAINNTYLIKYEE